MFCRNENPLRDSMSLFGGYSSLLGGYPKFFEDIRASLEDIPASYQLSYE